MKSKIFFSILFLFISYCSWSQCDDIDKLKNTKWVLVKYLVDPDSFFFKKSEKKAIIIFNESYTIDFIIDNKKCSGKFRKHLKRCFDINPCKKCYKNLKLNFENLNNYSDFLRTLSALHNIEILENTLKFSDAYDGYYIEIIFEKEG